MATGPRIDRTNGGFDGFIRTTTPYLGATAGGQVTYQRLGVTDAEYNAWVDYNNQWGVKYPVWINKDTRTKAVTAQKNAVKQNFISFAQPVLNKIAASNNCNADDRAAFNIKLRDPKPTSKPIPTTHPVLESINVSEPGEHTLRFKDSAAGNRAKPFGVQSCEIKYFIGLPDSPPDSVDDCTLSKITGRSPVTIDLGNNNTGKMAFYFMRWINSVGATGPWGTMDFGVIM